MIINKDLILAIETSCDETSAAVVAGGRVVLSNVIYSQIELHKQYGGVVPEEASRRHIVKIDDAVAKALDNAKVSLDDISAIAVTNGPGLVGALLVGVSFAKGLAYARGLPLIAVNHIAGHIASNYLDNEEFEPPFVGLVVSGGHTQLIHVRDYDDYELLGSTLDDAAGEGYDKVARCLNLPYPGGVEIDRLAKLGDGAFISFPRAWLGSDSLDFSFSGLKSAVINYLNSARMVGRDINIHDVSASFQEAVVEVLVKKAIMACRVTDCPKLAVAGGVAANSRLRALLEYECGSRGILLNVPAPVFCTDNAAMIAAAAFCDYKKGRFAGLDLNAYGRMALC